MRVLAILLLLPALALAGGFFNSGIEGGGGGAYDLATEKLYFDLGADPDVYCQRSAADKLVCTVGGAEMLLLDQDNNRISFALTGQTGSMRGIGSSGAGPELVFGGSTYGLAIAEPGSNTTMAVNMSRLAFSPSIGGAGTYMEDGYHQNATAGSYQWKSSTLLKGGVNGCIEVEHTGGNDATWCVTADGTFRAKQGDGTTDTATAGANTLTSANLITTTLEADLTAGACTAGTWKVDTGGATRELCRCNDAGTAYDCWSATTTNGPTD